MKCPTCNSDRISKNGHRSGKQSFICKDCRRQFLDSYTQVGYPPEVKQLCIKMYLNGLGFRAIERITGINHNSVIGWVKQTAQQLPEAPPAEVIPEATQVDELQTFVGKKK